MSAVIKTIDGYTLEDIVKAVITVLQPEQTPIVVQIQNTEQLTEKKILTRKEAASCLRISVGHLDNIIRKGEISVTRIGRRVLIKREDIEGRLLCNII